MPDGRPSLEGLWSFATATPLERPRQLAGKAVLTDAEAAEYLKNLPNDGCESSTATGRIAVGLIRRMGPSGGGGERT
jgi:hypothetical protein